MQGHTRVILSLCLQRCLEVATGWGRHTAILSRLMACTSRVLGRLARLRRYSGATGRGHPIGIQLGEDDKQRLHGAQLAQGEHC